MTDYTYPAVFTPAPEINGYSISFPDLPGICTDGDSAVHARWMARQALTLHLWGMIQDGDSIPNPTPIQTLQTPVGGFVEPVTIDKGLMSLIG